MFSFLITLCCAATGHNLALSPPLDPIAGTFAAVAYWRDATPPETVTFTLITPDGKTAWSSEKTFSADERRAVAYCDTSALPDGVYQLTAQAGDEEDTTTIRLRQGRTALPDTRPFRNHMLWMPMTGYTDQDLDDAVAAGYDTLFTKIAPAYPGPGKPLDYSHGEELIRKARARGMKVVLGWLLWTGLPPGRFYLQNEDGTRLPDRIDPCWDAAMGYVRRHAEKLLDHYMGCADIIGLAPTWGIYGEGGYASFNSGYSPYLLEKFNRWRISRGEVSLAKLPTADETYKYVLLQRFRFEYLANVWGELNAHLRHREPNGIAIGAWQEIYNGHMFQLALSEVPGADFAVNEMCFPWGTTYDQPRAIGETMGIRYKCDRFEDYRDYYLPLIARKGAEGQQAIGCQLSLDYADRNYAAWPEGHAAKVGFQQWEDRFAPYIRRVRDTQVVPVAPEVAYIQMTYPTASYPDAGNTVTDINLYEVVLRMYGMAYDRIPITRLSRLGPEDLAKYRLIVVPDAWYLDRAMWNTLRDSDAWVLLTGGVMQYGDGGQAKTARTIGGITLRYGKVAGGRPALAEACPPALRRQVEPRLAGTTLPADLGLTEVSPVNAWVTLGGRPLLGQSGRFLFLANRLLYACAYDPDRDPPNLGGSVDPSADEGDPWGKASSSNPNNAFGEAIIAGIAEQCGVLLRIPHPLPRHFSRYLGDHSERINVTGNIVVNQDAEAHEVTIRTRGPGDGITEETVTVPAYDFVALP